MKKFVEVVLWFVLILIIALPDPFIGQKANAAQNDEEITAVEVEEEIAQEQAPELIEEPVIAVEPIYYDNYLAREESRKGAERLEELEELAEAAAIAYEEQLGEYFTEEEVIMLARTIDAEAGAVYPLCRRAAVGWTVVNRLDNGRWGPTTIGGIISQPGQYAYSAYHSYSEENYDIALDVLTRWADEHISGEENEGRILESEYESFWGDGSQNHFYDSEGNYWDYSVEYDPYSEIIE